MDTEKSGLSQREEKILAFWDTNNIFEKTLEKKTHDEFVFYEGPPTANGKPGIHHLEARAFKDVIPRYKTMQGFYVRRKGGWDTHGLPVELQVEKELGLSSKKEIEKYGIALFNKKCKESVWQYLDIWNKFTHRIGYWIDQKNPYITYQNSYIESLWYILGEINKQKLLYKDYKVVPWCPRCGTALSSHELAQGYQDDKDLSVTAKFKIKGVSNGYFLAWTTTPWTLPGNVGLAVGENIVYVEARVGDEILVLAKERLSLLEGSYEIVAEHTGAEMAGMEYEPLYPYLQVLDTDDEKLKNAYKVYVANFVTTQDGTGIVHTAVMYGQDDFELGTKVGLPKYHLVDEAGHFIKGTEFLEGRFVKDEEVAIDIIKDLAHRGLLFKKEKYEHSYPHCWRCKTPLIYYARDSWYIQMSALREKLVSENKKINWEPSYIKEGRFGEWLRDIKDWAISRERYWGTPLPIWETKNGKRIVIDSIDTLKKYAKKSGNRYFVMRHGEAETNQKNIISCDPDKYHLLEEGKDKIRETAKKLQKESIDLIISSPFVRTRETTEIVNETLSLNKENIQFDVRLSETNFGEYEGKTIPEYFATYSYNTRFTTCPTNGETLNNVRQRAGALLDELESKYKNKNILLVTHGDPSWMLFSAALGLSQEEAIEWAKDKYYKRAEVRPLPYIPYPHNENYELDLHKPYIDEVLLEDENGEPLQRTKEVIDVWFDSGAMPFAQDHYPFDFPKQGLFGTQKKLLYPADYISEAIDQTRGWFYTLHAIGVLMGKGRAYKNVICLGHILDSEGKKMSKSLGNIIDPWLMIEKYGVDPLRFWMYSVNQPGESKNFDEKTVTEIVRKVFNLLDNVYTFYELYRDTSLEKEENQTSSHILDQWIIAKLDTLISLTQENLDSYKVLEPARAIREFIDDLSTWYLRRSRDRLKDGDREAKKTLYFVLKTLVKIMAPFTPFIAEDIYQKLRTEADPESVHLSVFPKAKGNKEKQKKSIEEMEQIQEIVRLGLEARQKANIKVRQPLQSISVKEINESYLSIVKDELNVKEVLIGQEFALDTAITAELKKEGDVREFIRGVQEMRKEKGLLPKDIITLTVETNREGEELLAAFKEEITKTVGAETLVFQPNDGKKILVEGKEFTVSI